MIDTDILYALVPHVRAALARHQRDNATPGQIVQTALSSARVSGSPRLAAVPDDDLRAALLGVVERIQSPMSDPPPAPVRRERRGRPRCR